MKDLKVNSAHGSLGLSNNLMKEITPYIMNILVDIGNRTLFAEEIPDLEPFLFHRNNDSIKEETRSSY